MLCIHWDLRYDIVPPAAIRNKEGVSGDHDGPDTFDLFTNLLQAEMPLFAAKNVAFVCEHLTCATAILPA